MRLIGDEAGPDLDTASADRDWPSRAAALDEQTTAVAVLEREYGSRTRLAAGSAATVLLCLAATVLGLAGALVAPGDLTASEVALLLAGALALAAGLAVPGWWLGRAAVRSGRSVVAALVRWHRLPETVPVDGSFVSPEHSQSPDAISSADRRRIASRDAVLARTYVFRGPLFVRIGVSAVLFLVVLLAWGISISGAVLAEEAFDYAAAATAGGVAVVLTAALAYVWAGVFRVNAAHARRDPISRRLLGR